jgi:hypothetical protein
MNPNKKNILKTYISPPTNPLVKILISEQSDNTIPELPFTATNEIWYSPSVLNRFTLGDVFYLQNNQIFPFQGGNPARYYTVQFILSPEDFYYVRVNNNGIVTDEGEYV